MNKKIHTLVALILLVNSSTLVAFEGTVSGGQPITRQVVCDTGNYYRNKHMCKNNPHGPSLCFKCASTIGKHSCSTEAVRYKCWKANRPNSNSE